MPARFLISSQTLGTAAASVTFSAIPATYTDLVLRMSLNVNIPSVDADTFYTVFNNDTTTKYSTTFMFGDGSTVASSRQSNAAFMNLGYNTIPSETNVFSNTEIYIPNYALSVTHPSSTISAGEGTSFAFLAATAGRYNSATAITQIEIKNIYYSFIAGSSFYLYGISKTN
jgi:hypothetical protein